MKLPVIDTYAFPIVIPSTKKTINMRPFLVREEKLLLMARESENYQDQVEAIAQVIVNCTNNEINPKLAPYFDIEYLLLQLRARSVGEIVTPIYKCHHIPEGQTSECGHENPIKINLTEISVSEILHNSDNFVISLNDEYTLHLRYPTIYTIHELLHSALNIEGKFKSNAYLEALCDVFDVLEEIKTGKKYIFSEYTNEEKLLFMESLSPRSFEQLAEFLTNLPSVATTINFTCNGCQYHHNLYVSGIGNFLD